MAEKEPNPKKVTRMPVYRIGDNTNCITEEVEI